MAVASEPAEGDRKGNKKGGLKSFFKGGRRGKSRDRNSVGDKAAKVDDIWGEQV